MMSWTRSRQALGGTDGLVEYPVAHGRSQPTWRDQIDAGADEVLEVRLKPGEMEKPDRPIELDEQIDIAITPRLSSGHGAEDREGLHAKVDKTSAVASQLLENNFKGHRNPVLARKVAQRPIVVNLGLSPALKSFRGAWCLANGVADTPYDNFSVDPPRGGGRYYLVRGKSDRGIGTYGDSTPPFHRTRESRELRLECGCVGSRWNRTDDLHPARLRREGETGQRRRHPTEEEPLKPWDRDTGTHTPNRRAAAVLLVLCTAMVLAATGAASAPSDSQSNSETTDKRSPWLAVPVVASNPKLGTSGGFLAAYVHKFDPESSVSLFGVNAQYTTTHSLIASLFARTSFRGDHHRVIGVLAYGNIKNDYDDYLGTGQPLKTNDNLRALAGRYLYRFTGDWFVGGQASIANYHVFGASEQDDLILEALGITGVKSAGLGAVMMHDSRDSQDMPTRGWFGNLNNVAYREWLGGGDSYDVYRLDVRSFWEHGNRHVFAMRQLNQFTVDAPGAAQASVPLRGYKTGQYLAKNMSALEAEERLRISERCGVTIFVGAAWLYGGGAGGTNSEGFYPSYGAGFQFILKPVQRLLANLEYAHGNSDNYGIYVKLGHAW